MISLSSLSTLLIALVIKYRYLLLYPITIIEGPLITLVAGFLVSIGQMNPFIALAVIIAGDVSGDIIYYYIGRIGKRWSITAAIIKYFKFELLHEKIDRAFKNHGGKLLLFGKLTHAIGAVFLIGAGFTHMDFGRFFRYSIYGTAIKSSFLLYAGYLAGTAYLQYAKYFEYGALIITVAVIIIFLLSSYVSKYLFYFFTNTNDFDKK
jgi:membrane protein DedA with SNARE-associated domain